MTTGVLVIEDAFTSGAWIPGTTGTYLTVILNGLRNPRSLA
jgi:hypothetical protein